MFNDPWPYGAILAAFLLGAFGWWIGFRWRSFAILVGVTVLGGLIGRFCAYLATPDDPGWLDGLRVMGDTMVGVAVGGGVSLIGLVFFHVSRRRRQLKRIRGWVGDANGTPDDRDFVVLAAARLEEAMARMEEHWHVKYVPSPRTGVAAYEDWIEVVEDPDANAAAYLVVPRRTRVRFRSNSALDTSHQAQPALSNAFDCIVLVRGLEGLYRAIPASNSRFCESTMGFLRAASAEAS